MRAIYINAPGPIYKSWTLDTDDVITDPAGPGKGYHLYARSLDDKANVTVILDGGSNRANMIVSSPTDESASLTIRNRYNQDFMAGCYLGGRNDGTHCTVKGDDSYIKLDIRSDSRIEIVVPKDYDGNLVISSSARLNHTMGSDVTTVTKDGSSSRYMINDGDRDHSIVVTMPDDATVGLRYAGT